MAEGDIKEVLASIKKTNGMRDRILKELGIKQVAADNPDDIYEFEMRREDMDATSWILWHGKCIDAGKKRLAIYKYNFTQVGHIPKSDKQRSRTLCKECGKRLDEKAAKQLEKDSAERLAKKRADYQEYSAYKKEWEMEQILLGKL